MGVYVEAGLLAVILLLVVLRSPKHTAQGVVAPVCSIKKTTPTSEQSVYRVGVLAIRGGATTAFEEYNATFATFLNEDVGRRTYSSAITFELVPIEFGNNALEDFKPENVDFVFANPSMFSCIESRYRASSITTFISRRTVKGVSYAMQEFGGVIFTRADNDDIDSIQDVKGHRVGSVSLSGLGSGQMQFREFQKAGIHYLQDPSQLIFMETQDNIVNGVLTGQIDIGLVRTDQLERYIDPRTGELLDLSLVKILQANYGIQMTDGSIFPFPTSTSLLYPEWPLGAMPKVDKTLVREVQASLLRMSEIASLADSLEECTKSCSTCTRDDCWNRILLENDCDATLVSPELSELAKTALNAGKFAGWSPPLSYMELRNLQEEIGILTNDNQCIASTEIADAIVCKPGYYRRDDNDLLNQCETAGIDCYGYQCICSPCVSRRPVEVAPVGTEGPGCSKFDVCGAVQQGDTIWFEVKDNLYRVNARVTVRISLGKVSELFELEKNPDKSFSYLLSYDASNHEVNVVILEIYIDDQQIDQSPLRLDIVERDCIAATGDPRRIANSVGNCVCNSGSVSGGANCVPTGLVLLAVFMPLLLVGVLVVRHYIVQKRLEGKFWMIASQELKFPDKARVLGHGSFGVVLEASYRGTPVAVKRALPPSKANSPQSPARIRLAYLLKCLRFSTAGTHEGPSPDEALHQANEVVGPQQSPVSLSDLTVGPNGASSGAKSGSVLRKLTNSFQEEIKMMAQIRHPCITTLIGAVVENVSRPMLVLELMNLGSLYDLLHNETMVIESETIMPMIADVVSGLNFLHSADPPIVHKDLKSTNILVDSKFRAKISDFGFSQKNQWFQTEVAGSLAYMAPELLRRQTTNTTASDVYAFGIVLTEIFSRQFPYDGEDLDDAIRQVADRSINKRPKIPLETPTLIVELINSCLMANPSERPSAATIDLRIKVIESELDEEALSVAPPKAVGQIQALLYQIFPKHVADALRAGEKPEAQRFDMVTVFFSDIVGYTSIASSLDPEKVSDLLDRLYTKLDNLCSTYKIFKVETIGDAYMTVTNLAESQEDHAERMARFALDAIRVASDTPIDDANPMLGNVEIRVGIHSGPVVAQVVGSRTPRYSVIGDTVNTASRFESNSEPGCIHCSGASASLLRTSQYVELVSRGRVAIKGKGEMLGYWVKAKAKRYSMELTGATTSSDDISLLSI